MKNSSGHCVVFLSPPSRWSGLKLWLYAISVTLLSVSTLAVEWIEISLPEINQYEYLVSTLAVEWIEIISQIGIDCASIVSTLAVEWIEIGIKSFRNQLASRLHPRGGVD